MTVGRTQLEEPREPPSTPVRPRTPAPPPMKPKRRHARWTGAAAVLAVAASSLIGTNVGLGSLVSGRSGAARLLSGFFPPDLSGDFLLSVLAAAVETLQISIAGLLLGLLLGFPLAVLIAGNVQAPRWLASGCRLLATGLRGVPEILWALIFVATVGLGPPAGVYAISLHAAGLMAKLCSEQLEAVDPAPVEALRLTGAGRAATTLLAIVPQARNGLASLVLYQWECNIRTSSVVGFVGAGGIGQALDISLRLFRYRELATLLIAVLILVVAVDQISRRIRRSMGASA